jgi:hypothetical protein
MAICIDILRLSIGHKIGALCIAGIEEAIIVFIIDFTMGFVILDIFLALHSYK